MLHNIKQSKRETEIVNLIAQAKCSKAIAIELNIAVSTVDKHLHNIFLKTVASTNFTGSLDILLEDFTQGVYLYEIKSANGVTVKGKFTKQ